MTQSDKKRAKAPCIGSPSVYRGLAYPRRRSYPRRLASSIAVHLAVHCTVPAHREWNVHAGFTRGSSLPSGANLKCTRNGTCFIQLVVHLHCSHKILGRFRLNVRRTLSSKRIVHLIADYDSISVKILVTRKKSKTVINSHIRPKILKANLQGTSPKIMKLFLTDPKYKVKSD